jgi:leader peptidase (prepilin peptidase) / N-methyltransferase
VPTIAERAALEVAPYRRRIAVGGALALVWAVWASGPGWSTPAVAVAAVAGVALAVVDGATHRLPDALTYPTTAVVGLLLAGAALADDAGDAALRALLGALVLGTGYLLLHLVSPSGLGLGDVKLAVLLGLVSAWYGWSVLWATAALPFLVGGLAALVLIVARRATRRTAIAFGPAMLVGTALALTAARLAPA